MMHFLTLIRWKNLVLITLTQILIKYALLEPLKQDYGITTNLNVFQFLLLVLATVCVASAGYIINDIEAIEADKINKPNDVVVDKYISEKDATRLFIGLNIIGLLFGLGLSYSIGKQAFFIIFILASVLLYIYAAQLKKVLLVGNILIACLVGLCVLLVGIFDLIPSMENANRETQVFFLRLILDYAIFAFMINLLRELVKDIEDIDGDYKINANSLPIVIGRDRATKVVFVLSLVPLMTVIFYLTNNLYKQPIAIVYMLITIVAPLIYATLKLFSANKKIHYQHISTVLKIVLLMGILSLLLFQFILLK
jgi:4-hydroxybenzoate polyprenyltransferase